MSQFLQVVEFNSAAELLAALSPWSAPTELNGYIFRGHSNDSYDLIPTSIRKSQKEKVWELCGLGKPIENQSEWEIWQHRAEYSLLREFYRLADRRGLYVPHSDDVRSRLASTYDITVNMIPGPWVPDELLELAGLAQHYGLPTRLLDWSYDPLISAYFAASSAKPNAWLSVWAFDADEIVYMNQTVHSSPLRLVTPPYHGNPNLAAQSGLFTNWSVQQDTYQNIFEGHIQIIDRSPLDALMKHHVESHSWDLRRSLFIKYRLRSEHAPELIKLLASAGYGASRIFPGYKGVAEEIEQRCINASKSIVNT